MKQKFLPYENLFHKDHFTPPLKCPILLGFLNAKIAFWFQKVNFLEVISGSFFCEIVVFAIFLTVYNRFESVELCILNY